MSVPSWGGLPAEVPLTARLSRLVFQGKMMQNVHLAPEEDEDDLYSGYNDYNPTFDTEVKMFALTHSSYG